MTGVPATAPGRALLRRAASNVYTAFADIPRDYFGAILVDPPTRFVTWSDAGKGRSAERYYPTMSWDELRALDVVALGRPDCALFLWACSPTLPESIGLLDEWGFSYIKIVFNWMKADVRQFDMFRDDADADMGLGYWTRDESEVCLLGTRGHPKRLHADVHQGIIEPRREHSRKPDCVHDRIERLVDGPFLELFARRKRPGWAVFGNQIDQHLEAAE